MAQIRKGLGGYEDLKFDDEGINATFGRIDSTGMTQVLSALNAAQLPILATTRLLELYDGNILNANDVDAAIVALANNIATVYKFPNQDVLDDIISAGSGVIISSAERTKLTQITDVGSGKIITAAERAKLDALSSLDQDDVDSIDNIKKASPVGSYLDHSVEDEPEGYLLCDGRSILRETYSELFAVIGERFGSVDANTFNLPDWRGLFPRCWDSGAGVDPDAAGRTDRGDGVIGDFVGTGQAGQNETHIHLLFAQGPGGSPNVIDLDGPTTGDYTDVSFGNEQLMEPNGGAESRPINMTQARMIRYKSV